jgi:protoheme IX farnesyltransferase
MRGLRLIKDIKTYYELTKPGIIYGNLLTLVAGFLLASKGNFEFSLFASTIIGAYLVHVFLII